MTDRATVAYQLGKKVTAADAIRRLQRKARCLSCGKSVRATSGDPHTEPWFEHIIPNPKCPVSRLERELRPKKPS